MSYSTYAIIVTVLFVIYISVTIALDLFKAPTGKKKEIETIDVSSIAEEESVSVSEVSEDGGFAIGQNLALDQEGNLESEQEQQSDIGSNTTYVENQPFINGGVIIDNQYTDSSDLSNESNIESDEEALYRKLAEAKEQCESIQTMYQESYMSDEFGAALLNSGNRASNRILIKVITI